MEEEDDEIEELCIIAGSWEEVSLDERRVENSKTWITFPEVLYQLTLRHLGRCSRKSSGCKTICRVEAAGHREFEKKNPAWCWLVYNIGFVFTLS